jgi:hypothetical protein
VEYYLVVVDGMKLPFYRRERANIGEVSAVENGAATVE